MSNTAYLQEDFKNLFHSYSSKFQLIFKILHTKATKHRSVFYSIKTIARMARCCTKTVTRATNEFHRLGWLCKKKRGYDSCLYMLANELLQLDIRNPRTFFLEEKCPSDVPVLDKDTAYKYTNVKSAVSNEQKVGKKVCLDKPPDRPIPKCLGFKELTQEEKQRLANNFSEYELNAAFEKAKWYVKQGNSVKSFIALFWNLAKKIRMRC